MTDSTNKDEKKVKKSFFAPIRDISKIFGYVRPYSKHFLAGLIFLLFSALVSLGIPYLIGKMVDSIKNDGGNLIWSRNEIAIALFGILFLQALFSFLRVYQFARISQWAMRDIRNKVYSVLIALPLSYFEQKRVGELTSRITADVQQLYDLFSYVFPEFLRQLTTILVGIPVIFFLAPKLTFFMLLSFPPIVIGAVIIGRKIRKISKQNQDELAAANVVVEESLQNVSIVKSFTNEWFEIARFRKSIDSIVQTGIRSALIRGGFVVYIIFGLFGTIFLVIWYGLGLIEKGDMTSQGELISFMIFTMFIGGAVGGMGDTLSQVQKSLGASDRLREILNESGEISQASIAQPQTNLPSFKGDLEFENVTFSYPTRHEFVVLKDVSFKIKQGETIAIAGPSGAGKSTIAQLLLRFFEVEKGEIKIDGKSIQSLDLTLLRRNIGIVPQELSLFGGTIRENILYGNQMASEPEIRAAAEKANALDFILSFPEGLDTIVGERGVKLSGGQKQRIAIARAILKDPSILILDEATSNLDSESERLVQDALEKLMKNRTTLVIAHRLSTLRNANMVLVVNQGQLVEQGTFETLSKNPNGIFNHLLSLQNNNLEQISKNQ